jgi:hypothetical protein
MSKKRILISMGSIPAKLDSVKYIGNRFKGGLALKTAQYLSQNPAFEVTAVKWKYSDLGRNDLSFADMNVFTVDDVMDYYDFVCDSSNLFDVYILAGAVANLMPVKAFEGKFPSHNYKENDHIHIPFKISPRIIDVVKKIAPRSTLIGYKLLDSSRDELISAGREVLRGSGASAVFANHPLTAKEEKIALTQDGAVMSMTFNEHVKFIQDLISQKWFRSESTMSQLARPNFSEDEVFIVSNYPTTKCDDLKATFGTFAIRDETGFWTTTRGKSSKEVDFTHVSSVDMENMIVRYEGAHKPTLNAPLLSAIFNQYSKARVILHNHKQLESVPTLASYRFPGTLSEAALPSGVHFLEFIGESGINLPFHGYLKWFNDVESARRFIENGEKD